MSETLYRKYRPKNFSEIIGQSHIVRTLVNAVRNNRVGQAYLFTGPRGTGKTSVARILAKTVNCANLVCEKRADTKLSIRRSPAEADSIPTTCNSCEECQACKTISEGRSLDIIEIDAASNTGVDNIRELRETVALPPTILKYKVYIIDEVHMLSGGAFNALLKTLEEPPAHVIFILATTEIHKVPATIISRCQRFDFARLPIQDIISKLSLIAKSEKIKIDNASLEMIAIAAEGSFRDAESLLAQIIALEDKDITIAEVEEILGTASQKFTEAVAEMIIKKDTAGAIEKINTLMNDGYDLSVFAKSLVNFFRQLMLLKINDNLSSFFTYEITGEQIESMKKLAVIAELSQILLAINLLLEAQDKISSFILPQLPLEIAIIKATQTLPVESIKYNVSGIKAENKTNKNNEQVEKNSPLPASPAGGPSEEGSRKPDEGEISGKDKELQTLKESGKNNTNLSLDLIKANWNKLLAEVKPLNHSLNALLSNCQVVKVENNEIFIATPYNFYKERLDEKANKLTIEKIFSNILGTKISVSVLADKDIMIKKDPVAEKREPKKDNDQNPLLADALEIMGGKIVE